MRPCRLAINPARMGHFGAVRVAFLGISTLLGYHLSPCGLRALPATGLGFSVAMVILLAELRLRHAEISGLMGGAVGGVLGLLGLLASLLFTLLVSRTDEPDSTKSFLEFTSLFIFGYRGAVIGSAKGVQLRNIPLPPTVEIPRRSLEPMKLLDTSALIAFVLGVKKRRGDNAIITSQGSKVVESRPNKAWAGFASRHTLR
jgi:hypothetical protein